MTRDIDLWPVKTLTVIVAGGGAGWEASVLGEIHRAGALQLHRRCLDVAEVLALSPHCDAAVLSTDLPGLDADTVLALCRDGVRVIGVGDPDRASRLGMEFAHPGEVESSVLNSPGGAAPAPAGSLIVVWGPHGAPGRSVIAASIAAALSKTGQLVTLVDADSRGGTLAQLFAVLDDVSGLVAACRSANGGDLRAIEDHAITVDPGLRLVTGVARAEMWAQVRLGPFEVVVRHISEGGDAVVIDVGPGLDQHTRHLLTVADRVIVVGKSEPVGLARLVRSLHDLQSLGSAISAKALIVVNQMRSASMWTERDVTDAVNRLAGVRPEVFIPADFMTLDTAALRGKVPSQVVSSSPFVSGIGEIVDRLGIPAHNRLERRHAAVR